MMKKIKTVITFVLIGIMLVSCLSGCKKEGGKSEKNGATKEIELSYWSSGMGQEWLDNMIEAFEKKYPEYDVTYSATASATAANSAFGLEDSDTTDLYLVQKLYDIRNMEPLNDVLDSTADGDTKSIREKLESSYLNTEEDKEGNVYQLTYGGGVLGFIYNKKFFEKAGIDVLPRTTDEMAVACDTLLSNDIIPICHFATSGYWDFILPVWQAQYDGLDYFINNFYACVDENGVSPSKDIFTKKDGRYEAIKACEKIITPDYVLQGSNSSDHITMQTSFLNGKCAMMISGSWLENEMKSVGGVGDFGVMKTPVVSSITDKLTTVKKESQLRKVITAIDAVTDGEKKIDEYKDGENYKVDEISVSAADWNYISAARNSIATNYSGETMYIPKYSSEKEGAKKFIQFMYSDEGLKIYSDATHTKLPAALCEGEIDTKDWSKFETEMSDMLDNAQQNITTDMMKKHDIFIKGGASAYAGAGFINLFCTNNENDRRTAAQAWESVLSQVNKKYENDWLANISE